MACDQMGPWAGDDAPSNQFDPGVPVKVDHYIRTENHIVAVAHVDRFDQIADETGSCFVVHLLPERNWARGPVLS